MPRRRVPFLFLFPLFIYYLFLVQLLAYLSLNRHLAGGRQEGVKLGSQLVDFLASMILFPTDSMVSPLGGRNACSECPKILLQPPLLKGPAHTPLLHLQPCKRTYACGELSAEGRKARCGRRRNESFSLGKVGAQDGYPTVRHTNCNSMVLQVRKPEEQIQVSAT